MPKRKFIQIENKNAILELLQEGKSIERLYLASNAYKDDKTKEIVAICGYRKIPMEKISRRSINRRSKTSSSESVIALIEVENQFSLEGLIDHIHEIGETPFIIIFGEIRYPHNVGAILRTAFAAGVNGIITPVEKANFLSDEIVRISMGTALRIPICEIGLFAAIKRLQKEGVKVMALDMEGKSIYEADLTGPAAFVLGSEDVGVSTKLLEKSDELVSVPMREGLGSLNVSVTGAVVMYEKVRQDLAVAKV